MGCTRGQTLPRARLLIALAALWERRAAMVLAPAGSGKSTLLRQFAAQAPGPVAWYQAQTADGSSRALLAALEAACVQELACPGGWDTMEDAAAALAVRGSPAPTLLAIDDVHLLAGTAAEQTLGALVSALPAEVKVVLASRRPVGFPLWHERLDQTLVELDGDDLRFRSWEIEGLFRQVYEEELRPPDLITLERCTEGWAAGLALFRLAVAGRSGAQRQELLARLPVRSALTRDYLADNVLRHVEPDAVDFLIHSSVLDTLTAELCDALLDRHDSRLILHDLERRELFVQRAGGPGEYRYHEVLRLYLEGLLVDVIGEGETRRRHARAAHLLLTRGRAPAAVRALARAEDWPALRTVLGRHGEEVLADPTGIVDLTQLDDDPWMRLARARRHREAGRIEAALADYRVAESTLTGAAARRAGRERAAVAVWAEPLPPPGRGWSGLLRRAVYRDPGVVADLPVGPDEPWGAFVRALAALLAGRGAQARDRLARVATHPAASGRPRCWPCWPARSPRCWPVGRRLGRCSSTAPNWPTGPGRRGSPGWPAPSPSWPPVERLAERPAEPPRAGMAAIQPTIRAGTRSRPWPPGSGDWLTAPTPNPSRSPSPASTA